MSKSINHRGVLCLDEDCRYRKSCANHETAGEYREEGGFKPLLWYKKHVLDNEKELICESIDCEENAEYGQCYGYTPQPKNSIGMGYNENVPNEHKVNQIKYLESIGKNKVKADLEKFLNECLETSNQDHSFKVTGINLREGKFYVEFNIVTVPEDNYIGFAGY